MDLGKIVKQFREEHSLSMDEFAKRCSLSKGYISMIENNVNPRNNKPISPTLPSLNKLAFGMGIELDDLLRLMDGNQPIELVADTPASSEFHISDLEKTIILEYRKSDEITQAMVLRALAIDDPAEKKRNA